MSILLFSSLLFNTLPNILMFNFYRSITIQKTSLAKFLKQVLDN